MPGILSIDKEYGQCQICGKFGKLTIEHVIPKNSGGGGNAKFYNVVDYFENNEKLPKYENRQNGITARTLCAKCNSFIGRKYDKDFGIFYNSVNAGVNMTIENLIKNGDIKNKLNLYDKGIEFTLKNIRPFNVAKRILASFCSIEHELIDRIPEIRKAILNPEYIPSIQDFAIFFCLKYGNDTFFSNIEIINILNGAEHLTGIESFYTSFYFKDKKLNANHPNELWKCINITNWLTDFKYNEEHDMKFRLYFIKNMCPSIPPDCETIKN